MHDALCSAVIDKQNEVTATAFAQCEGRQKLKTLISSIMDYPKKGIPWKRGRAPFEFFFELCTFDKSMFGTHMLPTSQRTSMCAHAPHSCVIALPAQQRIGLDVHKLYCNAERWYHYFNEGLQNQDVLYTSDTPDGEAKVFLDPNKWSSDGTIALAGMAFTDAGTATWLPC